VFTAWILNRLKRINKKRIRYISITAEEWLQIPIVGTNNLSEDKKDVIAKII
jgi:hypothetical protein